MDIDHQEESSHHGDTEGPTQPTLVRMRHLILDLQDQNLDLRNDKLFLKNFVDKLKIELNKAEDEIEELERNNYALHVRVEKLETMLMNNGLDPYITASGATKRGGDVLH